MHKKITGHPPAASAHLELLQSQIDTCKKFLDASRITGITVIFSSTTNGIKSVDLVKLETDQIGMLPYKELLNLVDKLRGNLSSKYHSIIQNRESK